MSWVGRRWRFCCFLGAVAALGAVLATHSGRLARCKRLPDGSYLAIVSISYGAGHSFTVPPRKAWQRFLVSHLPPSWTAPFGWWPDGGGLLGCSSPVGAPELFIFTMCEMFTPANLPTRLCLSDLHGNIYGSASIGGTVASFAGRCDWILNCWTLTNVPPTEKLLILEFMSPASGPKPERKLPSFYIQNPRMAGRGS